MLRKKFTESLTARIFLITFLLLLCAGAVTFGLIAWATPSMYTSVVNDDLQKQVDALAKRLGETELENSGPVIDEFIRATGTDVILLAPDGEFADTGSELAVQPLYWGDDISVSEDGAGEGEELSASWGVEERNRDGNSVVSTLQQYSVIADVSFADGGGEYGLYVTPHAEEENPAVRALVRMIPWLLLTLFVFSLLCAFGYSRYITRPVVRISGIAKRMAELDFGRRCCERRRDEIGILGRSLDLMAQRLSAALSELEDANRALTGEVEREREAAKRRTAFFSAASHELKTPLTIMKGQLMGMLEGVGVYRDRDKYLYRSLRTAGRMEELINEMLMISRMESGRTDVKYESMELAELIGKQLELDAELAKQRGQQLKIRLEEGICVEGDRSLLCRVVDNLISNAVFYSPDGAEIRVWCGTENGMPAFTVENTGSRIGDDALPHLFEAFYREEGSRNRRTGGSGLGLYIVRMILERHNAFCTIENTEDGVRAKVVFGR